MNRPVSETSETKTAPSKKWGATKPAEQNEGMTTLRVRPRYSGRISMDLLKIRESI